MNTGIEEEIDPFDIFTSQIFKNPEILKPDFVPPRLIARDNEVRAVGQLFAPVIQFGASGSNATIYGKTGCGKSVVVKYVLNRLIKTLSADGALARVKPIYLQCKVSRSPSKILYAVVKALDPFTKKPKSGVSLSDYYDEIWRLMIDKNLSLVLVLDEIDLLKDDDLLYALSRAKEFSFLPPHLFVNIIGVTNDVNYPEDLDPRTASSLQSRKLVFPPYDATQVAQILDGRLEAFNPGVVDAEVLALCAALAAQEHGDARRAIELLRLAAEIAEAEGATQVTPRHVAEAKTKIDVSTITELTKLLPVQSQLILYGLCKGLLERKNTTLLTTGDLWEEYVRAATEYDISKLSYNRFTDLVAELDMHGVVRATMKSRGRGGRTREIQPMVDIQSTHDWIAKTLRLGKMGAGVQMGSTQTQL